MRAMVMTKWRIAAAMGPRAALLTGALAFQSRAVGPAGPSQPGAPEAQKSLAGPLADQFDRLRALIKPRPGGFADVPWMTSLWEARKKAAAEGKPILLWVGDGHPLGFT